MTTRIKHNKLENIAELVNVVSGLYAVQDSDTLVPALRLVVSSSIFRCRNFEFVGMFV